MSITDSLDAAALAVRQLLAQEDLTNAVVVVAQDVGQQDLVILQSAVPIPLQTNMLVLVDVAHPNQSATPTLQLPGGQQIIVTSASGQPLAAAAMSGKCLFGISSQGSGFVGRLLVSPNVVPALANGPGFKNAGGAGQLDLSSMPGLTVLNDADAVAVLSKEAEGNNPTPNTSWVASLATFAAYVKNYITRTGGLLAGGPGVDVSATNAQMNVDTLPEFQAAPPITGTYFPLELTSPAGTKQTAKVSLANLTAAILAQEVQPLNFQQWILQQSQNMGNNVNASVDFSSLNCPFAQGGPNGVQFTQAGFFTCDVQLTHQITTSYSGNGNAVSQARTYSTCTGTLNGTQIYNGSEPGAANNYVSVVAYSLSFTRYFNAGDIVKFVLLGTGDAGQAGSVTLIAPSTFNITRL